MPTELGIFGQNQFTDAFLLVNTGAVVTDLEKQWLEVDLPTAYFLNNEKQRILCERVQRKY